MPNGNFYYGKGGFAFKKMGGGGNHRTFPLSLMANQPYDFNNRYVPGSGVGASSIATRRAKLIRSTICYSGQRCGRFDTVLGIKPQQTITRGDIVSEELQGQQLGK
jgi:hypothetical protein